MFALALTECSECIPQPEKRLTKMPGQKPPAIVSDLGQHGVRAVRLLDEEPILSELVVDGERIAAIREINPHLGDSNGNKIRDRSTR